MSTAIACVVRIAVATLSGVSPPASVVGTGRLGASARGLLRLPATPAHTEQSLEVGCFLSRARTELAAAHREA